MVFSVLVVDRGMPTQGLTPWEGFPGRLGLLRPGATDHAIDRVRHDGATDVLVLCRPREVQGARTLATTISGACPGVGATVRAVDAAPVALAAAASHALELTVDPPLAYQSVLASLRSSVSGALLNRVTRLDAPRPNMWQHLTSIFGRRHVVLVGESAAVTKVGAAVDVPPESTLLIGAPEEDPGFEAVRAALGPLRASVSVPPVVPVEDSFGSAGVEFVAFVPADPAPPRHRCHVCDSGAAAGVCPFCRIRTQRQEQLA